MLATVFSYEVALHSAGWALHFLQPIKSTKKFKFATLTHLFLPLYQSRRNMPTNNNQQVSNRGRFTPYLLQAYLHGITAYINAVFLIFVVPKVSSVVNCLLGSQWHHLAYKTPKYGNLIGIEWFPFWWFDSETWKIRKYQKCLCPVFLQKMQSAAARLCKLPMVHLACSKLSVLYIDTKCSHPNLRSVCEVLESSVTAVISPVLVRMEPHSE